MAEPADTAKCEAAPSAPQRTRTQRPPQIRKNKYDAIKYVTYYDLPPPEITKTAKPEYSAPVSPPYAEVPLGFTEILDS